MLNVYTLFTRANIFYKIKCWFWSNGGNISTTV